MNKYHYLRFSVWTNLSNRFAFHRHNMWNYSLRNNRKYPYTKRVRQFNEEGD